MRLKREHLCIGPKMVQKPSIGPLVGPDIEQNTGTGTGQKSL